MLASLSVYDVFFFTATAPTEIYTLSLHDALPISGLAAKIDREEAYHRIHAQMWFDRLKNEPRFTAALDELRPLLDTGRSEHTAELAELWDEMTMVRRSQPSGTRL